MHAAQAGQQCVLQVEFETRPGAQHLQATDLRLQGGDGFGEQGLVVVAGADHNLFGVEIPRRGRHPPRFDTAPQGREMKLYIQLLLQEADQARQGFA
ncbi:hypothetical protein D3C76_1361850 [compost metagenome]